ncbi:SusC/RagA family TonB-linked outer membrane protein [Maribacter sp. 2210JD10-5]|uniref:SusC/RagA family TonB-linked outer membrane protein n=1 Tax=Maribacter sp. 2210JD10-5 TaxID=3386272 RepID=UPI0039BCFA93
MNKKIRYFFTFAALLCLQSIMAQSTTVSGTISDDSGAPLPGANVVEKGTSNGTATDFDGNYSITVSSPSAVLVISSLGYATKEVAVNGQSTINEFLDEDAESLDEVIVTALGIERDRRSLGYAVTQLESEALTEVKTSSALNALQGKVAGVNITPPATGAAGSTRVIIRGATTLSGNNQPLYVVDGVTIDNTQLGAASEWGGADSGDGISSLNPDDIESVSVLKSGAAGALYGSRASGGVILITTKSGKNQQGLGVEYNSQITFDALNSNIRDFQREFGQGTQGRRPANAEEGLNTAFSSWGERLGSGESIQFDGVSRPYANTGNNESRFYRTGTTLINTLALSKGGEEYNYRFGVTNFDNNDILPNSSLNRKIFSLNLNSTFAEKLSLNLSARYNVEKVTNRPRVSDTPGNANFSAVSLPANVNIENLGADTGGARADGSELQAGPNAFVTNPYWAANNFTSFDRRNRFLGSATLRYDILDWLNITARAGIDFASTRADRIEGFGTAFTPLGSIDENQSSISQVDSDLIIGIDKTFKDDFRINALFGGNRNIQRSDFLFLRGERFIIPFLEILGNTENASRRRDLQRQALGSLYGSVELSYKNYLFLTVTGRNDWFSTLSAPGKETPNDDFYPSISGSFVLSDALEMPSWVSFAKIRASYAELAGQGGIQPFGLNLPFQIFDQGHLGQPLGGISTGDLPNPTLTPFDKQDIEIGLDLSFFNNRLGLDLAYYSSETTNDILPVDISNTSGFGRAFVNIGVLENEGVEAALRIVPVQSNDFQWNINTNVTFNESLVVSTDENDNNINVGNVRTFDASIQQVPGNRFGVIFGTAYERNPQGQIVYDADGLPVEAAAQRILGDGVPPWAIGFNNSFRYKNWNMSFLLDGKFGGQIYSGTDALAISNGLDKRTLEGRETGLTVTGVTNVTDENPNGEPFTFTHDDTTLQAYYGRISSIAEEVTQDADFIKLRQFSLGYSLPSSILDKTFLNSVSVSVIGRNLFFLYRATDNIDPESSFNGSNAQGVEFFSLPTVASYGFSLNLKF